MKLIVGLGNPGQTYQGTRHNLGREAVSFLGEQSSFVFSRKPAWMAVVAEGSWKSSPVALAWPETYMNVSGKAVAELVAAYNIAVETQLLVVVDDLALPFGKLRLRPAGSSGGHNGLKSIDAFLGNRPYARLRMGIGDPRQEPMPGGEVPAEKYVLAPFTPDEKRSLSGILERAADGCRLWFEEPVEKAMSVVNAG